MGGYGGYGGGMGGYGGGMGGYGGYGRVSSFLVECAVWLQGLFNGFDVPDFFIFYLLVFSTAVEVMDMA